MQKIKLFMDPLCGWCYAAAPEVKKLAETAAIELIPTGLFSQAGRTVTPEFARHAWSNDQRIAQLTGQVFSDSYRDNLLQEGMPFNSFPIVLALTWVQQQAPEQELNAYHAIQTARYVDGRDNTQLPVLANILANLPLALSEAEILQALQMKRWFNKPNSASQQGKPKPANLPCKACRVCLLKRGRVGSRSKFIRV